ERRNSCFAHGELVEIDTAHDVALERGTSTRLPRILGDLAVAGHEVAEHECADTSAGGDATCILRRGVRFGEVIDDAVAVGQLGDTVGHEVEVDHLVNQVVGALRQAHDV